MPVQGRNPTPRHAKNGGRPLAEHPLRVIRGLERSIQAIIATMLGVLMLMAIVLNVADGIGRTVFAHPLGWSEELLSYTLIWCVFLGGAVISMRDEHVKMDFISHLLSPRIADGLRIAMLFIGAVVCAVVAIQAWDVIQLAQTTGRRSVVLRVPMSYVHSSVFLGFLLMGFLGVLRGLRLLLQPASSERNDVPETPA